MIIDHDGHDHNHHDNPDQNDDQRTREGRLAVAD